MPLVAEEVSFENKKIFQETCEKCEGHKVLSKKKELKLVIEKGMKDKDEIIFTGESDEHPFKIPGDLHVILRQNKHSFFYLRKGNDLYAEVQLNFKQAILGFNKSFRHFDNKELRFSKKKVTQPNEMKAIIIKTTNQIIDFQTPEGMQWIFKNIHSDEIELTQGTKKYTQNRNVEIFNLIQQGAVLSKGKMYKHILNSIF